MSDLVCVRVCVWAIMYVCVSSDHIYVCVVIMYVCVYVCGRSFMCVCMCVRVVIMYVCESSDLVCV